MLYDRLMERFEKGTVSQQLLSPQLVRLTAHDRALVSEFAPVLADAGFEVEPFDDTCVAVKAIPTLFGENESPRELLLEALDEWQAGRGQVTRERMRRRVAQMACKHAIKGGDRLNETQVRGFLQGDSAKRLHAHLPARPPHRDRDHALRAGKALQARAVKEAVFHGRKSPP